MANLDTWNKVKRPPESALKNIKGGRLSGMTDINPQWRLQIITEIFGECGKGWYYDIERFWTETGSAGELMCFVHIKLYVKYGDEWSKPISGIGGSAIVAKESSGLRANDEGYKMATTDALSVAMKQLGIGADIYMGRWDGSKYKDDPPIPKPTSGKPTSDTGFKPDLEERDYLESVVDRIKAFKDDYASASDYLIGEDLDADQKTYVWDKLDSATRSGIKKNLKPKE